MKRVIIGFTLLVALTASFLFPVGGTDYTYFNKGIVYTLLKDDTLAINHMGMFFRQNPDPALQGAFFNLIRKNDYNVTKQFKQYLDMNHRSQTALVGIALSTSGLDLPGGIDNLERASRLDESFSVINLCLGYEYMKQKNFPQAEFYLTKLLKSSPRIPEYSIILSKLYLRKNEPAKVVALLKQEADRQPDNYYFNYYTGKALFYLGQYNAMGKYAEAAAEVAPEKNDARLLKAQYLTAVGQFKEAQFILRDLKYEDYNEDYCRTYARVLFEMKDHNVKNYLDMVYSQNKWDKEINKMMGLYYEGKKMEKGNVQNWINRTLLCGAQPAELQKLFPSNYHFPAYKSLPFFQLTSMKWVSDRLLAVGAKRNSGEGGKLFLIQPGDMRIVSTIDFKGTLTDIFPSDNGSRLIFSTVATDDKAINDSGILERLYLYAVSISGTNCSYQSLTPGGLLMPSVVVGYNSSASLAYITDSRIIKSALASPFSVTRANGEKEHVYSNFPFHLLMYNFGTQELGVIKDMSWLPKVPISYVKKYCTVFDAAGAKSDIQALIEKGQSLELTSSETVKIHFSNNLSSFVIYVSNLKNSFQATLYDKIRNSLKKIDASMFLPKGQFAELKILNFDSPRKELLMLTKDVNRRLISFNYNNYLYSQPLDKVCNAYYDPSLHQVFALTERTKKHSYTETTLHIVSLSPYMKRTIDTRRDLREVRFVHHLDVYFDTISGEYVKMDRKYNFIYVCPSFEGALHAESPSKNKIAAYINGRLIIMDGPVMPHSRTALSAAAKPASNKSRNN